MAMLITCMKKRIEMAKKITVYKKVIREKLREIFDCPNSGDYDEYRKELNGMLDRLRIEQGVETVTCCYCKDNEDAGAMYPCDGMCNSFICEDCNVKSQYRPYEDCDDVYLCCGNADCMQIIQDHENDRRAE